MTRPSVVTQLVGTPAVAFLLFSFYAFLGWEWYANQLNFLLVVAAAFAARRTLSAVDDMRRWKDWQQQLARMTGSNAVAPAPRRKKRLVMTLSAIIGTGALENPVPLRFLPELAQDHNSARRIIFGLCAWACAYVAFALVGMLVSSVRRSLRRQRDIADADAAAPAPVAWLLDRAAASPSRSQATAELPDYCAALLKTERSKIA